jgi:hypothetical protein
VDKVLHDLKARINSNWALLCISTFRLIIGVVLMIHFSACAWYGLGKLSPGVGWIYVRDIHLLPFGERYLFSFLWSMARLHPSTFGENMLLDTVWERIFAIVISLVALCGGGYFISSITNTMAQMQTFRQQRTRKLWLIREYVQENRISTQLAVRIKKYVEKSLNRKLKEQNAAELSQMLPLGLLMDLHFEAWTPCLTKHQFFDMFSFTHHRVVWRLGQEALQELPVLVGDSVFTTGDPCFRMLFVRAGELRYHLRLVTDLRHSPSANSRDDGLLMGQVVRPGSSLSEAALWTPWENHGELRPEADSSLLALVVNKFISVLQEHKRAMIEAVERSHLVVEWLNANPEEVSDIFPVHLTDDFGRHNPEWSRSASMHRKSWFSTPVVPGTTHKLNGAS